jgi:plasmid stability protein
MQLTQAQHARRIVRMARLLQVRNVPDRLHRQLKARAASENRSLSDYVLRELERMAARPTQAELMTRLARLTREALPVSAAEILREERDAR